VLTLLVRYQTLISTNIFFLHFCKMEQPKKKCLPMYPAAINPCAKFPTAFAEHVDTEGGIPHMPSVPPTPEPTPPKHTDSRAKSVANAVAAAVGGATASGAAAHTAQQAFKDVPTSRISRPPPVEAPTVSNPAIPREVEMTQRPSISGEGLRNRSGFSSSTVAEEAPLIETEAAGGAAESEGLLAAMGGGAATAEEFGGAELAAETLGMSVVAAGIGGAVAGGVTYMFGHHHHH